VTAPSSLLSGGTIDASSSSVLTLALASAVNVASLVTPLTIFLWANGSGITFGGTSGGTGNITDSVGNTYVPIAAAASQATAPATSCQGFICLAPTALVTSTTTATVYRSGSAASFAADWVQWPGYKGTYDGAQNETTGSGTPLAPGAITLAQAASVVCVVGGSGSSTTGLGAGATQGNYSTYTNTGSSSTRSAFWGWVLPGASGSYTPSVVMSGTGGQAWSGYDFALELATTTASGIALGGIVL